MTAITEAMVEVADRTYSNHRFANPAGYYSANAHRDAMTAAMVAAYPLIARAVKEQAARVADSMADIYSRDAHDHMSNVCAGVAVAIRAISEDQP